MSKFTAPPLGKVHPDPYKGPNSDGSQPHRFIERQGDLLIIHRAHDAASAKALHRQVARQINKRA